MTYFHKGLNGPRPISLADSEFGALHECWAKKTLNKDSTKTGIELKSKHIIKKTHKIMSTNHKH